MPLTDQIAELIEQLLDAGDGTLELRRNDLAAQLGCVPSQITYVLSSRFTPRHGYRVESRRGGGGSIRILRLSLGGEGTLSYLRDSFTDTLDEESAAAMLNVLVKESQITPREAALLSASLSSAALAAVPLRERNFVRADMMRQILLTLSC